MGVKLGSSHYNFDVSYSIVKHIEEIAMIPDVKVKSSLSTP